jgi:hypothetical protein
MPVAQEHNPSSASATFLNAGVFWPAPATIAALLFFHEGFNALLFAWQLPEFSHGPLIPVLSLLVFLQQLKSIPISTSPVTERAPGIALLISVVAWGL